MGLAGEFGHFRKYRNRFFAQLGRPARRRPGAMGIG
jgi:hypothetical protein